MICKFRLITAAVSLAAAFCTRQSPPAKLPPSRIISLAPSITETLFALGLGDRVVGVTSYCNYPPEVKSIEKIGGYTDANLEKIIAIQPDLVVLSAEHDKQRLFLNRFGIRTLTIDNSNVAAVCSSFAIIGRCCDVSDAADNLIGTFRERMKQKESQKTLRPKVLLCVGRDDPGAGRIMTIYAAGRKTFYNELIEAAGGENVIGDPPSAYLRLSLEGILALAPEIIIDIAPAMGGYNCEMLVADWYSIERLPAVRKKLIYCISSDYASIPGPRLLLLLDDLRHIIMQNDTAGGERRDL